MLKMKGKFSFLVTKGIKSSKRLKQTVGVGEHDLNQLTYQQALKILNGTFNNKFKHD